MSEPLQPVIVGAGPAGIRAAERLVRSGLRPIVLDEGQRAGGQIYRRPLIDDGRSYRSRYGSGAGKAQRLHQAFEALLPAIDYRPETLVWNISAPERGNQLDILSSGVHRQIGFSQLILCTGATDRVLPFPGWTTPGVYTLGASQTALKAQGCTIGDRVAFMGSGPLLYLVAWQYMKAGARVEAVLDTAPLASKRHLLSLAAHAPRIVALGLFYGLQLQFAGVKVRHGVRPEAVLGKGKVEGLRYRRRTLKGERVETVTCDALAYGFALRPETQLADLAGCRFRFDERDRVWLPERDALGRTSRTDVYVAGDGSGIAGADAAEISGELAAVAMLQDQGNVSTDVARLLASREAILRERDILERAFPFPVDWFETVPDETTLCRCEEISVAEARRAMTAGSITEINRLKALSRVGMGRCQGRMCSAAATELLSGACGVPTGEVGRLRAQAPVKPIPLGFGGGELEARS
ncbi:MULTISPECIES: FAD/NAD(P)-binding oxidoreductase [unclassified Ensifer]|uniref:FAD/NAD(P)-dependent oxidoreductase n=1 Tax=unclassified Ensifer TaxID=2633371 RepID=UPI000812D5C4|nr:MULTISPECIES: FAD/NAD(P)-binding oxidoreductase [unclassified Ensifer]OCO99916.1 FAD/NAD(P)-binding oxidoreductase [Ensifer sp. LC13]OCP00142.1 FAD/NAD(P)-binding oxidoreductase [Ensifer sp. LC11]OCP04002.1 FAD/NAD(P)-binding oxidoreductase [Ensifer sp. LC14]OCP31035.1 FAD/NAD(P)-binding oxidoreductase [Ensifer sp. LC499]